MVKTRTKFVVCVATHTPWCPETGTKFPKAVNTHSQLYPRVWVVVVDVVVEIWPHNTKVFREGTTTQKPNWGKKTPNHRMTWFQKVTETL